MRLKDCIVSAALLLAACAPIPPQRAIIDEVAIALGGPDRILALNTLTLEGDGENVDLGQDQSLDSSEQHFKVTSYKRSMDFGNKRGRLEQVRAASIGNTAPTRQIFAVDGNVAFNIDEAGVGTRLDHQVVMDRRAELLHHP